MSGPRHYDLIIVGASFAGLACARTAALRGLKVAVIERKRDPGEQVRTTGILVKEAAEDTDIPSELTRRIRGVRLYAPNGSHSDHWAPGYYFLATDTAGLLRWMAQEAWRAGATLHFGGRFDEASQDSRAAHVAGLGSASLLVGADGANSAVARAFGLDRNARFLGGVELELAADAGTDPRFLHCFLDSKLAPGYLAWALAGVNVTQVGVAVRQSSKPDMDAVLDRVRARLGLRHVEIIGRRNGLIPVGGVLRRRSTGRVMLIGDAAGHCSPTTGGGIALALRLGRRTAQAASDWLEAGGEHPAAVIARETPRFGSKLIMRRVLDLAPPNWLWNSIFGTAAFRQLAHAVYFHRRGLESELPPLDDAQQTAPIEREKDLAI
jgi:digeranylgeranylglycerophospholipid reductase